MADWMVGASPPPGVRCQVRAAAGAGTNAARMATRPGASARSGDRMTTAGDIQTIVSSGRGSRPDARVVFRAWPAADAKAAVILLHGLGGHSDRFQECGRYW